MSRVPQQSAHMPLDPWAVAAFTDNANTHLTEVEGGLPHILESMHPSHQQPISPLATTHSSTYVQAIPPKESPLTTQNMDPGSTSFQEDIEGNTTAENSPRLRLWGGAGSLDPTTGVFSRAADHPRIRTAQACEKCRARKAKVNILAANVALLAGLSAHMRLNVACAGPINPSSTHTLPDGSQPATAVGQKMRKRASTMPSTPHRSSQIWGNQQEQQEHGVATPTSPASESSVGSGNLVYPPAPKSGASPMTPPHGSLGAQLSVPVDFPSTAHRRQARVSEGSAHDDAGATTTRGLPTGVFGQDIFMITNSKPDLTTSALFPTGLRPSTLQGIMIGPKSGTGFGSGSSSPPSSIARSFAKLRYFHRSPSAKPG
ncbi:hypothetical protein EI94DRAFT_1789951 [Lactarius quietus]|nr:hypothetical protein EI94DRAFT_1789951 [Lactarius quietus]